MSNNSVCIRFKVTPRRRRVRRTASAIGFGPQRKKTFDAAKASIHGPITSSDNTPMPPVQPSAGLE